MDVLGQEGDPEMPSMWAELQFASGRYFTLVFSATGTLQRERGYASLPEATTAYERLLAAVAEHPGHLGLGVDEDTALLVEGDEQVVGDAVDPAKRNRPDQDGQRCGAERQVLAAAQQPHH